MENPEGEGGGGAQSTSRDQRKEIVPGFNEEELFEFSLDQIMNGNLDERREVVEYLVDEFDEMSLAMVEGFRQFANRDAPQDHSDVDEDEEDKEEEDDRTESDEEDQTNGNEPEASTSKRSTKKRSVQHDDDKEDDDLNSKRAQYRHYFRTYWRKLKTNPVEYAKVLKRISDYQKRRLDGLTDEERDKFNEKNREYQRNRYHSLSLEGKTKRIRKINELRRKKWLESEEYREKEREKDRNSKRRSRQNMTEDQRKVARQKNAEAKRRSREKKKNIQK